MIFSYLAGVITFFIFPPLYAEDVAVLYALESDLKALREASDFAVSTINGTNIQMFRIGNHRVFATQMGVGNVETAINVLNLLARNRCDLVIGLGPAGSLIDVVRPGSVFQIDKIVGYQRGSWKRTGWELSAASTYRLPHASLSLEMKDQIQKAQLASGDAFIASSSARERVARESGCVLVDMNSFGLVQACEKAGVPLVIFKVVSDGAGDEAGTQFRDFIANYDGILGGAVRRAIENLPVSEDSPAAYENIRELLD